MVKDGRPAGIVTSGNFSPMLGHGIALGFVDAAFDREPSMAFDIEQRGRTLPATVVGPPVHPGRPVGDHRVTAGRASTGLGAGHPARHPRTPTTEEWPVGTYIPHTEDEVASMLAFLGLSSVDELFDVVPEALRLQRGLELADGAGEPDVLAAMEGFADRNRARSDRLVCFAGGGAYDHEIPSVTRALAGRSEFVTSYTPYQPEVAQGVLQAIFEYQTMVARLAGLPVANASLYDGGSAAVEAVNLGVAASGRQTVWVSAGIHPHWRQMLATCAAGTGHRLPDHPPGRRGHRLAGRRRTRRRAARRGPGGLSELPRAASRTWPRARALCDRTGALLVVGADPVAAGMLRSAGEWGADVVVGEGQVFGTTLGFGGPYLGLFACAQAHVRRLPGRLVGETVDVEGRRAYVTTLRAREQDIRREKATSNVCTNQTLMAVTAAIQLGWLGTSGLARAGPPVCPGHPLHPRGAARARQGGALRRRPGPAGVRRAPPGPGRRWWSSGWPTPASWPASPWARTSTEGTRTAGRGDRAPDPRRDRRLCHRHWPRRWRDGRTAPPPPSAATPGARPPAPPCSAATPSPPSSSSPIRDGGPGRSGPPGSPSCPSTSWSPRSTCARTRSLWPRCPNATWWPTSPACPTGSSRWTSGPTRSARAP